MGMLEDIKEYEKDATKIEKQFNEVFKGNWLEDSPKTSEAKVDDFNAIFVASADQVKKETSSD